MLLVCDNHYLLSIIYTHGKMERKKVSRHNILSSICKYPHEVYHLCKLIKRSCCGKIFHGLLRNLTKIKTNEDIQTFLYICTNHSNSGIRGISFVIFSL